MAKISVILWRLRTLLAKQMAEGQTDGLLLEQFVSQRDEMAFAALLERHGPMVLGVCRRILHDEHRAEDVFQATFLVLVRKAGSIRKQQSISSWLHGVAIRLARRARAEAARTKPLDLRNYLQMAVDAQMEAGWHEARDVLDEELQRLPDNYRLPLVLCYLEGLTRDEAAARLGWTANKLRGFLERGRDRLRSRLIQRGVTLSVVGSTTLLADTILTAAVPPFLAVSTIRAALQFAAGTTLTACGLSGTVVALTQGALTMMALKKLTVIVALCTVIIGSGVGIFVQRPAPVEARQPNNAPVIAVAQEPPKNKEPQEERVDRFGDPLPTGAVARLGTLRFRHPSGVRSLAYTPDGTILASSSNGIVRLWDAKTGKLTRSFRGDPADDGAMGHPCAATTKDGKTLLVMASDESIHVWDLASGKNRWHLKDGAVFANAFALALSADGKTVAKGLNGLKKQQLSLWDLETGQLTRTLGATDRSVSALAFSRDGKLLAAGDGQPSVMKFGEKVDHASSVRLWDPASGRQVRELKGHTGHVTSVAFSPDDKLLASVSHDGTLRLWNQDGQLVRNIAVPEGIYPDLDGRGYQTEKGIHYGGALAVVFSPDGRWIACGGYDGCVRLWEASTGKALRTLARDSSAVMSVAFSRDGKVLASGHWDQTIRLWDPASGKELQQSDGQRGPVRRIAVSPDGKLAAACGHRFIHLWSLESGQQLQVLRGHTGDVYAIAFSPDGRCLASASQDQTVRIWDVAKGHEVRQLLGHKGPVYSVAFTVVDNMLLSGGEDKTLRFWDWSSAKEIRQIQTQGSYRISISRDGRIVGVGSHGEGKLWEVATGKELRRIGVRADVVWSPDGRTFVTHAEKDEYIRQWSIATGDELSAIPRPPYRDNWVGAASLVFSPDGRLFAVRQEKHVEVWEVATGKIRRRFKGHQGRVGPFVISPDGRTMLTGGNDTTILIWDLERRHETRPNRLTPGDVESAWRDLSGDDAERADRSIGTLAARADQGVPFLNKHLGPVKAADPKRLAGLIADLDSGAFAVRDKAVKELQRMRELATPALKDGLGKSRSLETRRRIEELLAKQRAPLTAGELLQSVRAIEVLERMNDPGARRLLQRLSAGAAQARITQEAQDAMNRLERPLAK